MPRYSVTRRLPFAAADLFQIVRDVAAYPEFVPLCHDVQLRPLPGSGDRREVFRAELFLAYPRLRLQERLVSTVTVDPQALTVRAVSSESPVKHLDSRWSITEVGPDLSDVQFWIDYQLKSRALQFMVSGAFDYAVRKIMNAFEARAQELYGRAGAPDDQG